MQREPVLVGQIVGALGVLGLFYEPVREAIVAAGGETALTAAVTTFVGIITGLIRSRVSPVEGGE